MVSRRSPCSNSCFPLATAICLCWAFSVAFSTSLSIVLGHFSLRWTITPSSFTHLSHVTVRHPILSRVAATVPARPCALAHAGACLPSKCGARARLGSRISPRTKALLRRMPCASLCAPLARVPATRLLPSETMGLWWPCTWGRAASPQRGRGRGPDFALLALFLWHLPPWCERIAGRCSRSHRRRLRRVRRVCWRP